MANNSQNPLIYILAIAVIALFLYSNYLSNQIHTQSHNITVIERTAEIRAERHVDYENARAIAVEEEEYKIAEEDEEAREEAESNQANP